MTDLLPRPGPARGRAEAAATQRDRLLRAVVEVSAEVGVGAVRVADVIARAGVSRRAFYEQFPDLEACALAAYDRGVEGLSSALGVALAAPDGAAPDGAAPDGAAPDGAAQPTDRSWRTLVDDLLAAYLGALASEPGFARFALVDVLALGPAGRARYLATVDRFADLLRMVDDLAVAQEPQREPTPDVRLSLAAGALNRFVTVEVLSDRAPELARHHRDLLPELLRFW